MSTTTTIPTASAARIALAASGFSGTALDIRVRMGAPARAAARVEAATRAALSFATPDELQVAALSSAIARSLRWTEDPGLSGGLKQVLLGTWALLTLDGPEAGVGGPAGCGGPNGATARPPAFGGRGTGRRHANDGGAWTAAIEQAAANIKAVLYATPLWALKVVDDELTLVVLIENDLLASVEGLPPRWLDALIRRAVRDAYEWQGAWYVAGWAPGTTPADLSAALAWCERPTDDVTP